MLQRIQSTLVFFFGTPRRALYSVIGVLVLIAIIYPPTIQWASNRLLDALAPVLYRLAQLGLVVLIIYLAFGRMFGIKLPKPKKEKDG